MGVGGGGGGGRGGGEGKGVYSAKFNMVRIVKRSKLLYFYFSFLTEKAPLLYTLLTHENIYRNRFTQKMSADML